MIREPIKWYALDIVVLRFFSVELSGTLREGLPENIIDWSDRRGVQLTKSRNPMGTRSNKIRTSSNGKYKYMFDLPPEYEDLAELLDRRGQKGMRDDVLRYVVDPLNILNYQWAIRHNRGVKSPPPSPEENMDLIQYTNGVPL